MAFSDGNLAANLGGIGYSEEQIELLDVATDFCRERSPIDKVRALLDSDTGFDRAVWDEMAELGWLGIAIPEERGGVGLSLAEVVPVQEQMGRRLLASPFQVTTLAAQLLIAGGREAQKSERLPKLATGMIATLALCEPHADWDLANITAQAKPADGGYVLSGTKQLVQWAEVAELIVATVMVDGKPGAALIDASAIPEGALRREAIVDETRRSAELTLDGIAVPAEALMPVDGLLAALDHLQRAACLLQSAEMAGGTQAVIDYTIDYLQTRKQFGKVIGEYQALKHPIADAYVEYEKARSHMLSAAYCFNDQGVGTIAVHMAKASADKSYGHAADRAVQFHGGFGFTHDCDAGLYRRNAIWNSSQFGDAAWHRAKLADLLF